LITDWARLDQGDSVRLRIVDPMLDHNGSAQGGSTDVYLSAVFDDGWD
jgi:hypothetical protein